MVYTSKRETRDAFIKKFSQEEFERVCKEDPSWEKLKDIPIPPQYSWIFEQFIIMWYNCEHDFNGNVIFTVRTILDYEKFIGINFTIKERRLLLDMKSSAFKGINECESSKDV